MQISPRGQIPANSVSQFSSRLAVIAILFCTSAAVLAARFVHAAPSDDSPSVEKRQASSANSEAPSKPNSAKPGSSQAADKRQSSNDKPQGNGPKVNRPKPQPPLTPEREAAALAFARQHHADVAELLERLKRNRPAFYQRAVNQLLRSSERISQLKDRDPERYELELKLWKTTSRIQLATARATMSAESVARSELDAEFKAAVTEQQDTRIALRKLDRDRAAKRVTEVDKDLAHLVADRDAAIEKQLVSLHENVERSRRNLRGKSPRDPQPKSATSNETRPNDVKPNGKTE